MKNFALLKDTILGRKFLIDKTQPEIVVQSFVQKILLAIKAGYFFQNVILMKDCVAIEIH